MVAMTELATGNRANNTAAYVGFMRILCTIKSCLCVYT